MAPFRLFDLPYPALRRVLRSGFNVVHLALSSRKCHQEIVKTKVKERKIQVTQNKNDKDLYIYTADPNVHFDWWFREDDGNEEQRIGCDKFIIDGHLFWIKKKIFYINRDPHNQRWYHPNNLGFVVLTEKIEKGFEILQKYVKSLVKAPTDYTLGAHDVENFREYFIRNVIDEDSRYVEIYGRDEGDYYPITHEVMNVVLDNTPPHCHLRIDRVLHSFQYNKRIRFHSFRCTDHMWYNSRNLLNTHVRILHASIHEEVTIHHMKQFITRWTNGNYSQLRYMELRVPEDKWGRWHKDPEMKRILYDGLNVTLWTANKDMRVYNQRTYWEGMTVELANFKRADGVGATIGITREYLLFVCGVKSIPNSPIFRLC